MCYNSVATDRTPLLRHVFTSHCEMCDYGSKRDSICCLSVLKVQSNLQKKRLQYCCTACIKWRNVDKRVT
jgi:hypothetical protein